LKRKEKNNTKSKSGIIDGEIVDKKDEL